MLKAWLRISGPYYGNRGRKARRGVGERAHRRKGETAILLAPHKSHPSQRHAAHRFLQASLSARFVAVSPVRPFA